MPEEPLEALELARRLGPGRTFQAPGHLVHHGQAHGDVEPVDQVLGLGVQVEGKLPDVGAAVGEEGDLLVGLHALGLEELEKPALRLGVVRLDVPEGLGVSVGRHGLAGDHVEPPLTARSLVAGMDVPAVEADRERQVRDRQLLPSPWGSPR